MSVTEFLIIWLILFAAIAACRVLPALVLHGRSLSERTVEWLGYIPPAAFAALVANDLFSADLFADGLWAGIMPLIAAGVVAVVALKTRSMLWCCVVGVVCYVALTLI